MDRKCSLATGASRNWNQAHVPIHNLEQRCIHLGKTGHFFLFLMKEPNRLAANPDSNTDRIPLNLLELLRSLGLIIHQVPHQCTVCSPAGVQKVSFLCTFLPWSQEHGFTSDPPIPPNDQFGLFHVFPKFMGFLFHMAYSPDPWAF